MTVLSFLVFLLIPTVKIFLKESTHIYTSLDQGEKKIKFLEGIKIIIKNPYLSGIFLITFIYELLVSIFDYNFKIMACHKYSGVKLTHYFSCYSTAVNCMSFVCMLFGINKITEYINIRFSLMILPIFIGIGLTGFLFFNSLPFLFILMVASRSFYYSFNIPLQTQLYIPINQNVRHKTQAWIDSFGSRASKEMASLFNTSLSMLQGTFGKITGYHYYLFLCSILGFPLLIFWAFMTLFLGKLFQKATEKNDLIC